MSRLIVKNLPKSVTDTKLKELFSEKGVVTDVQLKYTKDGNFRRFAFIGYKTEEQATLAQSYFDQICVDTCKISVERCTNLGDPSKPRSWSKYANDSSLKKNNKAANVKSKERLIDSAEKDKTLQDAEIKNHDKKKNKSDEKENDEIKKALEKHKNDPSFAEFLETHSDNNMKRIWNNNYNASESHDDELKHDEDETRNEDKDEEKEENEKLADKVMSDLQYMEALKKNGSHARKEENSLTNDAPTHGPLTFFTVKVRGLGCKHAKKHIKEFFRPLKPKSIRVPQKIKGIAYVGFKTEQTMKKALLKNKSFLEGRQLFVSRYEQKVAVECNEDSDQYKKTKWKKQEEAVKDEECIAESGRMFIRNLTYTTTEDDIRKLFEKYGPLSEVNLPVDRETRKLKGFGTVTFVMPEHAVIAYNELDGSVLDGRMLHILPGKEKTSLKDIDLDKLPYKQKKALKLKANADSSHNWNTLFFGHNAVADVMGSEYKTDDMNSEDEENDSNRPTQAVQLALGETKLVENMRNFLKENGVCLDAFNRAPKKRSNTVILVKHLPAGIEPNEIREMFATYGELARVIMPPTGLTALVEFVEPYEARKAFHALAYKKFKYIPLYLEWAPDDTFSVPASKMASKSDTVVNESKHSEEVEEKMETAKETSSNVRKEEDDEPPEADTTLFVKNINFATTKERLTEYFSKCGPLHYVTIATKIDPENPSNRLPMGHGFVRYKKKRNADHALKTLQMSVLDGKSLELKRSERTLMSDVKTARKHAKITEPTGAKILIRNLSFAVKEKEIKELFGSYGELKAVRLPKKIGSEGHRGFAFVEYFTRGTAEKAFNALCQSTHLYGRRLVLEWAQVQEDIEEMRKRVAKRFYQEDPVKRQRKSVLSLENRDSDF